MRVYYRGPDALVTGSQLVWLAETTRVFPIADLRAARISRRRVRGVLAPAVAAAAAATALVTVPGFIVLTSAEARLSLFGVAALIVTIALVRARTGSRWELIAEFGTRQVTLYESADETAFHQVTRALGRALEAGPVAMPRPRSVAV